MNFEQARFNMIEQQIRPWQVLDSTVLSLLALVRREDFVPPAHRNLAFVDTEVPLREGGREGQVMLAPRVEARLLQALNLARHERVLEVGAGSGYMTALMAHKAQHVFTLEIQPALVAMAAANLRRAGIANASLLEADGAGGLPAEAPFDAIVLSGSVADVPQALLDQLKPGGRLLAIVGHEPMMRAVSIAQLGAGQLRRETLFDTVAPRLKGFAEPVPFHF